MPDLPINTVLPVNDSEVNTRIKWLTWLQGGGLAIFVTVLAISATSMLFKVFMDDRNEDRQTIRDETKISREEDKEFRQQMLEATVDHTKVTSEQTATQRETNKVLDETKNAIVDMGEDFKELADQIEVLSTNEKNTADRLNRVLEKAWGQATTQPQPVQPTPPQ